MATREASIALFLVVGLRMKLIWTDGMLAEGLRCYRAGEFFAAHEHWEVVWLQSQEPEKTFLQALIQVAAAFHHLQDENLQGTLSLLQGALGRLERYPDSFAGIAVTPLRKEIQVWLQALETGGPSSGLFFPQIHLDG